MADVFAKLQDKSLLVSSGLVAGEWKNGQDDKTFLVYEPSSATVLQECANLSRQDFIGAIESAKKGSAKFHESTTAKERGALLRKWSDLVIANADDLALILSLENGKTFAEARGEVVYAASFISWFAEEATRSYGDTIPSSYANTTVFTFKEPVGVCGIVTPWNFPAAMITRKIAPAFAAGCSVIIKPPSETPFSALALAKLALASGIPSDIIHVVPTKDREASMELANNPIVKKLSFTGSTGLGKMLTKAAADTMKRVSMELGGNAPFIVFDDADIDQAVEGALICKFRCSGQTCVCANRLLVHEAVKDQFIEKLVARVKQYKLGRGIDEGITQGPLVNAAAVQKVDAHVQDALKKGAGAVLHTGGKAPEGLKGYFYEPTVISGVTTDMEVAHDETFGPLAAIFSFKTEAEAVELANATEYGLAGYFFSKDISRVMRVARRLECGMLGVNTGLISAAEAPFGGMKESGLGREGSKYGLAEYQNIKSVTIGNLGFD
ncbi:aldehyde dehydrogenase domain-containing protein [Colletotrichum phormii]|uniref:Succinate-semialdehyde dehydrogenase, mitochondrial n=1 Tax=Colletotrichum phormii TaxID=359342 RepID=A0AAI9ZJ44_9PEZI|nr:aldehyde dehydrogenase domain-containing protein [Colletotrichum phormii]KAK1625542.1 aldehyde dehydrogenase domain-containing protein [Colletotrichum phormii]